MVACMAWLDGGVYGMAVWHGAGPGMQVHLTPEELLDPLLAMPQLRSLSLVLQTFECPCPRKRSLKRLGSRCVAGGGGGGGAQAGGGGAR
jgi:hypothetical protein